MWVETFLIFMNRRMDFFTIQNGILNIDDEFRKQFIS